jgi:hypothetical protein
MVLLKNVSFIFILFLINSCIQTSNSSSTDESVYKKFEIDTSTPAGQRLSAAFSVIKTNCISCHSDMNLKTDAEWISSGYLTQGSATSSMLYCRIKGSNCGAEDMPKDSSLSQSDITTIKTWIDNL